MIGFGESIELTSNVNGKRLLLRKDIIDVVFEVDATTVEGKFSPACTSITMRNNTIYPVKETYDQVMDLMGRRND